MRIIAGRYRGRRLIAPAGRATRPSSDRVREALFDILAHGQPPLPDGAGVLDLFAGSGALGLEAASREARHVTFIDNSAAALDAIRRNLDALGGDVETQLIRADATRLPRAGRRFDLALIDAPYRSGLAEKALAGLIAGGWLAPGALIVVELGHNEDLDVPPALRPIDERRYGTSKLVFLRAVDI